MGLRKLSNISLKSNKLRKLSGTDFVNLSNSPLRVLILSQCGIQYISMGAFKHLTHLKMLDISENRLLSLHQDVFVNLNQLDKLDIIGNRFRNFHFFNVSLKYLSYVGLSLNWEFFPFLNSSTLSAIKTFPVIYLITHKSGKAHFRNVTSVTFDGFPCMQTLHMEDIILGQQSLDNVLIGLADSKHTLQDLRINLHIKSLNEKTFFESKLKNLTSLVLRGIISEIRDRTFYVFSTLSKLTLYRCSLQTITEDAFNGLRDLHYLNLKGNFLTILPIFKLPQLQILDLSLNKVAELFRNPFRNLHKLEVLKLSSNGLMESNIGKSTFSELVNLKELYLGKNQLRSIFQKGDPFTTLVSLTFLDLQVNRLIGFQDKTFHGLTNLTFLRLSRNNLWFKEKRLRLIFESLSYLEELDLEVCGITIILTDIFTNLTNLKRLFLGQNSIATLEPRAFKTLTKVQLLYLNDNKISSINRYSFEGLDSLLRLDLSYNPFHCACSLLWFMKWIYTSRVSLHFRYFPHVEDSPVYFCASPPDKADLSLFDFKISERDCVESHMLTMIKITSGVLITCIVIACVVIRYRWYLRYYLFLIRSRTKRYATVNTDD